MQIEEDASGGGALLVKLFLFATLAPTFPKPLALISHPAQQSPPPMPSAEARAHLVSKKTLCPINQRVGCGLGISLD